MDITCRQCGKEFVFTEAEQEFYKQKGFALPHRCKECRPKRQSVTDPIVCTHCGTELPKEAGIYCDTCIANYWLEHEMKIQKMQAAIDEKSEKLKTVESNNKELDKLLSQKEQLIRDYTLTIEQLSQDLEKANQLHSALNQWFQPTLNGLEERVIKRLETLETGQNKINERLLQLAQKTFELFESITLSKLIRRSFEGNHKPSPQTEHQI